MNEVCSIICSVLMKNTVAWRHSDAQYHLTPVINLLVISIELCILIFIGFFFPY